MALPVLLRRLAQWRTPGINTQVLPPIRVAKDRFLNRPMEFERHLQLAAAKCGDEGWVLLLLDADDDCPAAKGAELAARAHEVLPHRRLAVVLANGSMPFCVELDNLKDTDAPIHQPAAMLVAAD